MRIPVFSWLLFFVLTSLLGSNIAICETILTNTRIYNEATLIQPGKTISAEIIPPDFTDDECVVLRLKARLDSSGMGGANYALQILIDGHPLINTYRQQRLLNKDPKFTCAGLNNKLEWYGAGEQGWMLVTGPDFAGDFWGTAQDYEFMFDLTGLVRKAQRGTISFKNLMLSTNPVLVFLDYVELRVMKRSETDNLLQKMNLGNTTEVNVMPDLPSGQTPGSRPYEIVWSGRTESPRAQVSFENIKGWTMRVTGDAKVSLSASVDYQLWRKQLAKFTYGGGEKDTTVEIRPPAPIEIKEQFDAVNLILFGAFGQDVRADLNTGQGLHILVLLEDSSGIEVEVDLGFVKGTYWGVQHGILTPDQLSKAKFPMKFKALIIGNCAINGTQNAYLESLAFYKQNRKPETIKKIRSKNPIYPVSDKGNLPTPPRGVKVYIEQVTDGVNFISKAGSDTLRFFVRPGEGSLNGVTVQWNDKTPFHPMAGGGIKLEIDGEQIIPKGKDLQLVSSKLVKDCYIARWRYSQVEWEERYWVSGRTLVLDVTCRGGVATGVNFGCVAGLHDPKGIEIPYLIFGNKPGPWIGCGDGLFISVLPDIYKSDFSNFDERVTAPSEDRIGLWGGTLYGKLTNGLRNNLRDRILVSVSSEFAETLPNAQNPPSPNRKRLAPYLYFVENSFLESFFGITKRYGIDHIIVDHFAIPFTAAIASENFEARWRLHPNLSTKRFMAYRKYIKEDVGYLFGTYLCLNDLYLTSEYWNENFIALWPNSNWSNYWPGAFTIKEIVMPYLAKDVGQKFSKHYGLADNAYMDVTTIRGPYALDYEAGSEGAGIARVGWMGVADSIVESRKWFGSITSEGLYRWMYAGLTDIDYATIVNQHVTHPAADFPLLVDFDLLKIHPFEHGTMMSYGPSHFLGEQDLKEIKDDKGQGEAPKSFYQYLSASLAYGHMLAAGYGYVPKLSRFIQLYCLMQGIQKEYLTDTVASIYYHNGNDYLLSNQALMDESYKQGRVCVKYKRGLIVQVNYNKQKNWTVDVNGTRYDLPPFGWVIYKPGEILAFSALQDGKRVDYVSCPEYIYINSGNTIAKMRGLDVKGAVWIKHEKLGLRLIPCGDLGPYDYIENPPGLPKQPKLTYWDLMLTKVPPQRGCKQIIINTQYLLHKKAKNVVVITRDNVGKKVKPLVKILDEIHIQILPEKKSVDYLLR